MFSKQIPASLFEVKCFLLWATEKDLSPFPCSANECFIPGLLTLYHERVIGLLVLILEVLNPYLPNDIYTRCNRRNGPDFGRVFLRSNYTDITQNTYIQS